MLPTSHLFHEEGGEESVPSSVHQTDGRRLQTAEVTNPVMRGAVIVADMAKKRGCKAPAAKTMLKQSRFRRRIDSLNEQPCIAN